MPSCHAGMREAHLSRPRRRAATQGLDGDATRRDPLIALQEAEGLAEAALEDVLGRPDQRVVPGPGTDRERAAWAMHADLIPGDHALC